jgi:hypothetical protein
MRSLTEAAKRKPQRGAGGSSGSWGFLIFEKRTLLVITGTMTAERFEFRPSL